jgi:phospholipase/lecithinase/hemolysin
VWVEVLADRLGLPAPAPSFPDPPDNGTNYAWGGAETGLGLSFLGTPNVGEQIVAFKQDRGEFSGDELIVVAAGGNDLVFATPHGPAPAAGNLGQHIFDLAAAGGKTFLVANSHVATLPVVSNGERQRAATFNEKLDNELDELEATLDVTIHRFDMAGLQAAILQNPGDLGLTNITLPACVGCGFGDPAEDATVVLNPDEYFRWDNIHWTRVVHERMGEEAAQVVGGFNAAALVVVPEPCTLVLLALALPLWSCRRRSCEFVDVRTKRKS